MSLIHCFLVDFVELFQIILQVGLDSVEEHYLIDNDLLFSAALNYS